MDFVLQPWQFYLVILAGWINRQQQEVIDYLLTENQVVKEKVGTKRILLNDEQRRRLAVKGKILGRKRLEEVGTLFTPNTILRWHRQLVAKKWDHSDQGNRVGRPRIRQVIVDLILRFAKEKPVVGIRPNPRCAGQRRPPRLRYDGRQRAQAARDRTGAESKTGNHVVDVHQITLGSTGCDRLHDRRSLDQRRTGNLLSVVCDGIEVASRPFCRLHHTTE